MAPRRRGGTCTALVYKQGQLRDHVPPDEVGPALGERECLVWLDVEHPTEDEFAFLAREFRLHPLALKDVHTPHRRPKIDQHGDTRLIVLFDAKLERHHGITLHEVDAFVGANYLITVHRAPVPAIAELRDGWRRSPALVEPSPLGLLLYHLADRIIAGYFPIVDALEAKIDEVEGRLFESFDPAVLRDIFALRRDLIRFRKVLGPERDIFHSLVRREDALRNPATAPYFADVVDRLFRVTDSVDAMRELLTAALESYLSIQSNTLSIQSNALNQTMRRLTALTAILTVPALIAGIYGMQLQLPGADWEYGYAYVIALMVLGTVATLALFRRKDWL